MIDPLANTSIHDIALANALCVNIKNLERIDINKQKIEMQNLAFSYQQENTDISEETAQKLNQKYNEITSTLENDYDMDLSSDYWIDFHSFVPGHKLYHRFCY